MHNVLFISAEASPYAKAGGLGDVAGALPGALCAAGMDARLIMPKYRVIPQPFRDRMQLMADFEVQIGFGRKPVGLFSLDTPSGKAYFLDNEEYFGGDSIYGYTAQMEAVRTVFFARAVLEAIPYLDFQPEILHCNDWHTALIPALVRYQYPTLSVKTLLTIHNLRYQGIFSAEDIRNLTGLPEEALGLWGMEFYGGVNFLKGGILYADRVNTVSPRYAEETKTPEYGEKLEGVLAQRGQDYVGILNGIDYGVYAPRNDDLIETKYSWRSVQGKAKCKEALCRELGLEQEPMTVALISRLVEQKGLDIVGECIRNLLNTEAFTLVVLGTGEPYFETMFRDLQQAYPGRVSANICFDEALAHRIYAGSDLMLVPSRFEPCGLTQMIAMKYGTLPLVRETGGLYDSVKPYNEEDGSGFGFTFAPYAAHDLAFTLRRALRIYREQPETWATLRGRAMRKDYSWKVSAGAYGALYDQMTHQ